MAGKKPPEKAVKFSEGIARQIIELTAEGKSTIEIGRMPGMPHRVTMFRWMRENSEFQTAWLLAKQVSAEMMAEDMLLIADDGTNDTYYDSVTKTYRTDFDVVQRSRLRVDTRKFLLAKLLPKKYGDKLDLSADGNALFNITIKE